MAEKQLQIKLEDQLNCSICLDTFTNPKLLQCSDIFCQQCLGRLMIRDQRGQPSLTCPTCRQVTPIPANGAAYLSPAFHISQLLEILNDHRRLKTEKAYFCLEHGKKEL